MSDLPYRIGLQQRMLPNYRAPFFEALGRVCPSGLGLFAGQPRPVEAVETQAQFENAAADAGRQPAPAGRPAVFLLPARAAGLARGLASARVKF